jgi:hypothetical protein
MTSERFEIPFKQLEINKYMHVNISNKNTNFQTRVIQIVRTSLCIFEAMNLPKKKKEFILLK